MATKDRTGHPMDRVGTVIPPTQAWGVSSQRRYPGRCLDYRRPVGDGTISRRRHHSAFFPALQPGPPRIVLATALALAAQSAGLPLKSFFATESAFLAVLFAFNLLSLYPHQTTPTQPCRQPGTLRKAVFLAGAVLGTMGRDVVRRLSAAWGGLAKHQPLIEKALDWLKSASPKLVPPEARQALGGGGI